MNTRTMWLCGFLFCISTSIHAQIIATIAGTGSGGYVGDGGAATLASIAGPAGICLDNVGMLYVADINNHRIRTINSAGIINTISGDGSSSWTADDVPALSTGQRASDVRVDANGNIYFPDLGNSRLRKIDPMGIIHTIAGNGTSGASGDGGPATAAQIYNPGRLTIDAIGNVYLAGTNSHNIRKVDTFGIITTIAGTGTAGYSGDGGPATAAQLNFNAGMVLDDTGNLYLADQGNNCVRKINTAGIITTIAGTGTAGYSGDGGPAATATLNQPFFVTLDALNNLYISDRANNCIRKVTITGIINTIAGTGTFGFSGDGGTATLARLYGPSGIVVDSAGNVYFSDQANARLRAINNGNHMPAITGGHVQTLSVCENVTSVSLDALLAATDVDAGQTLSWVLSVAPLHGSAAVSYATTATGGTLSPIGTSYTPAPGYWGGDTFTVRIDDGITAYKTTVYVSVTSFHAGTIAGASTICVGDTTVLTNGTSGGVWTSANTTIATVGDTGIVLAVAAGTCDISYTVTNSCGTVAALRTVTVIATPECSARVPYQVSPGQISGLYINPNPTRDIFSIKLSSPFSEQVRIMITDVTGKEVSTISGETNSEQRINFQSARGIPDGIYFINAVTPHGNWRGRIVVDR